MENQEIEYIDIVGKDVDLPSHDPECYSHDPNMYRYYKSIKLSQGFDVDDEALEDDDEYIDCGLKSVPADCLDNKETTESCKIAVEEFNRLKGTELEFLRAVNYSWYIGAGCTLYEYLTFECTDGGFYEAKLSRCWTGKEECILGIFRPAKHYPRKWEKTPSSKSENSDIGDGTPSDKSENSKTGDDTPPSSKSENSEDGDVE